MTFKEIEQSLPNGFHDAKMESIAIDYKSGTLRMALRILVGLPGESNRDEYMSAELKIDGLCFCSIEPPDPTYPFKPNMELLGVSGDGSGNGSSEIKTLTHELPTATSHYRFFVEQWNSFIYIAAADVQILWSEESY